MCYSPLQTHYGQTAFVDKYATKIEMKNTVKKSIINLLEFNAMVQFIESFYLF
jgi:hypothetical protein